MFERLAVIGDVHGDAERLSVMLSRTEMRDRTLVLVGDFVNRGPDTQGVLDLLVQACEDLGPHLILIAGNHELALLTYLDHGDFALFAHHGGMATIRSYVGLAEPDVHAQFVTSFPEDHELLVRESLVSHYEAPGLLISHAGYDPARPDDRTLETLSLGSYPDLFDKDREPSRGRPNLVVCGHYVQRSAQPYDSPGFICLDTGCGSIGSNPLTSVLLPERAFIQV